MTRRDWWLGILVILIALLIHALVIIRSRPVPESTKGRIVPLSDTAP
jgi:hypothetical protein